MIEQIIAGLVVTGVTALGAFAYRHPRAYYHIGRPVMSWLLIGFVIGSIWNISNYAARDALTQQSALLSTLDSRTIIALQAAIRGVAVPAWIMVLMLAAMIYMTGLAWLWKLVAMDKEPSQKRPPVASRPGADPQ